MSRLALERRAGGLDERARRAPRRRSARARSCRDRAGRRAARGRARSPRAAAAAMDDRELGLQRAPGRRTPRAGAGAASGRARPPRCARRGVWMRSTPGVRMPSRSPARPLSACGDQVLGRLARGAVEQRRRPPGPRSRGRRARRGRARAGRRRGAITIGVVGGRGADLLAQLDDDPLGRALADARHGLEAARCRRPRRRPAARAGVPPESTASATFGPTAWTPISSRNRSRSSSVAKP